MFFQELVAQEIIEITPQCQMAFQVKSKNEKGKMLWHWGV